MVEEKQRGGNSTTEYGLNNQSMTSSDGLHHDCVAQEALGGHSGDLGKSYFTSINFIGTVIVRLRYLRPVMRYYLHSLGNMSSANIRLSWMGQ
jgi:hypothetical protein